MAKKAKGGPAWLATFADLMSLLMAMFVLLYAMSSTDVPKYKAVVESLNETLGNGSELTPEQEQFFNSILSKEKVEEVDKVSDSPPVEVSQVDDLKPLYDSLIETYSDASQNNEIKIEYDADNNQIKLVFPEQIAFDPGRADLKLRFENLA